MSESNTINSGQDESSFAYPGWRVAFASGAGVLVSFASLPKTEYSRIPFAET
jgi:hypothetical protein